MTQGLAQIAEQVYEEWARQGRSLTLPPDELEGEDDSEFWSEVMRRANDRSSRD